MDVTRALARPLIAGIFVYGGVNALRNSEAHVPMAEPIGPPVAERVGLPTDTEFLVKLNGGVQVGAGLALALGKLPRLSALALAVTLVPTTAAGHRFWEADDSADKNEQAIHLLKNLSMLGGLIYAANDTGGRPSVPWRAGRAARTVQAQVRDALPAGD